jgi:hypothetical protein
MEWYKIACFGEGLLACHVYLLDCDEGWKKIKVFVIYKSILVIRNSIVYEAFLEVCKIDWENIGMSNLAYQSS